MRIYRVYAKGRRSSSLVVAEDVDQAIDYFFQRGRVRRRENASAEDRTDALLAKGKPGLEEVLASPVPSFVALQINALVAEGRAPGGSRYVTSEMIAAERKKNEQQNRR